LRFFQAELGLTREEISSLERHRETFLAHRDEFAEYMHSFLSAIPETRRIVELMETRGGLRRNWRCWYEGLFTRAFDDQFYEFLWGSGLKHVARNVDQRFIHLGYCKARLFLGEIIDRELPSGDRSQVRAVIDKMVDQCLLVATDAFLAGTTQCDREVINGIAHQVRNPLTVIGGFITNLRKKVPSDSPLQVILDTMFQETRRLEAMVRDVGSYIDFMQREPGFAPCSLDGILGLALQRLRAEGWVTNVELRLDEVRHVTLDSDGPLLEEMFYHLLENGLEAAQTAGTPIVRVTGRADGSPPSVLTVEIYNNGRVPAPEEVPYLFTPFYSSKPAGSGFGLPIAMLVARKTHAEIDLEPIPEEGMLTTVSLPV
jgi:signal transduction histidine kinase